MGKSGASASSFETLQEKSSDEVLKRLRDIRDMVFFFDFTVQKTSDLNVKETNILKKIGLFYV